MSYTRVVYPEMLTAITCKYDLPPVAENKGMTYIIKVNMAQPTTLTVNPQSGELIDGAAVLSQRLYYISLYCDGTQWVIIG